VKLKKYATETFQLLTEAYGEYYMYRVRVSKLHKRLSKIRESVEDGDRPGSPHEAVTEENIEKCEM
jgi:hypothetical protein